MSISLELPGIATENTPEKTTAIADMSDAELLSNVNEALEQFGILSPEEQQKVDNFAKQINLHDSEIITRYGEAAQSKLESFADSALKGVAGRDIGEIGNLLSEMSVSIQDFNDESESKLKNVFRSAKRKAEILKVKYEDVTKTLERIKKELLGQRSTLLVDIKTLDEMYNRNLEYFKELTMYILAGKQKLEETRKGELESLRLKAEQSGLQEDAFAYSDFNDRCESFEKQLYDLELTRAICLQTAPQIRLVQKTDDQLSRKIMSSINNTIPVWKQKIAVALAIQHSEDAAKMQRQIYELTSTMLEDTAKKLHASVVSGAKESEKGIVKIEALQNSNAELLATIDDVLQIQEEGRRKRAEAERILKQSEEALKKKLISTNQQTS